MLWVDNAIGGSAVLTRCKISGLVCSRSRDFLRFEHRHMLRADGS